MKVIKLPADVQLENPFNLPIGSVITFPNATGWEGKTFMKVWTLCQRRVQLVQLNGLADGHNAGHTYSVQAEGYERRRNQYGAIVISNPTLTLED